jgi:hypothetical protein
MELLSYSLNKVEKFPRILDLSIGHGVDHSVEAILTFQTNGVKIFSLEDQQCRSSWAVKPGINFTGATQHHLTSKYFAIQVIICLPNDFVQIHISFPSN